MKILLIVLLFTGAALGSTLTLEQDCQTSLQSLFSEKVTKDEASNFLQLQGNLTLHRLAWVYLKSQKKDKESKIQSIENTIIELLNEKYTNTDADFIKARSNYESQPLSRQTLSEIAPYIKEVLSEIYGSEDQIFKLNASDIKLLSAIAKFEKLRVKDGIYDHRFMDASSPLGILNFIKVINSSYKIQSTDEEKKLDVDIELEGLEMTLTSIQKKMSNFLNKLDVPLDCQMQKDCAEEPNMESLFNQNEDVQKIFWNSLSSVLESDDVILDKMSYGDLWLNVTLKTTSNDKIKLKDKKIERKIDLENKELKPNKIYSEYLHTAAPRFKSIPPNVIRELGLIIEDPVMVIVKDKEGRTKESWSKFGKSYLDSMATAIIRNEKVFLDQNKMYDRKSGRQITLEDGIKLLRESQRGKIKEALSDVPAKMRASLLEAWINNKQSFVFEDRLYSVSGNEIDPKVIIMNIIREKSGIQLSQSKLNSLGNKYLVARANALSNNSPYFLDGNKTMESYSGRHISSPFRSLAAVDVKIDKTKRKEYENLSDIELIKNFNREKINHECSHYGVLNKKTAVIKIYSNDGLEVYSSEMLLGSSLSDQRTRWTHYSQDQRVSSQTTGAGIFTVKNPDFQDSFNKKYYGNNLLSFIDEGNNPSAFSISQIPNGLEGRQLRFNTGNPSDRRVTGGNANVRTSDFSAIKKWLRPSCKVYVLPEEKNNKFTIKDNELKLVSDTMIDSKVVKLYNYSQNEYNPFKIDIKIINKEGDNIAARQFIETLENEKSNFMKNFRITNDEYNDLAMLAYGIMGNESKFGTSPKLYAKEVFQSYVITGKILRGDDLDVAVNTSRGHTQIKNIPGGEFAKMYPEIKKWSLLIPRHSAIATMGYLVEALHTMKNISSKNRNDTKKLKISRESMIDYLGYLYQGNSKALKTSKSSEQAIPELNKYIQKLKLNMSYIEISQQIK